MKAEAEHAEPLRLAALYAAWATLTPEGKAKHRAGILFKTPHKLDMHHLVPAEEVAEQRPGATAVFERPLAASRRLPAHRRRHRPHRRARSGPLLHQVPQPGQGQLLHRPEGKRRHFQSQRLRREARRLPARREDLRDERRERERQPDRRAGGRHRRQPDVRRHRTSHLQRLHEVLHLPEAGAGRHSAGGNPHAERRAGTAVGLRDLQPADALESAQLRAAVRARGDRIQGPGGRPGPGGLHAGASSDERRPHGRRRRWPEDRAAAAGYLGRRRARAIASRSGPFTTSPKSTSVSTSA